jgi:hypothetical protein
MMAMVVHAEILLPIVRTEFTPEMQARYIAAIALSAGVSVDKVRIVSISDAVTTTGNRRLLGSSYNPNALEIHTSIYDSKSERISDLNAHLQRHGLPAHRGIRVSIHKEVISSFKL